MQCLGSDLHSTRLRSRSTRGAGPSRAQRRFRFPSRPHRLPDGVIGYITGATLAASIVLGGATRSGTLGDAILQLLSVILLIAAFRELVVRGTIQHVKRSVVFIALMLIIPIAQLLPLPLSIWKLLPERSLIAETYVLIGRPQPASPITMTPNATWLSALSLLPPIAVFFSAISLGNFGRRNLVLVIVAMALMSVFLGLLQFAQGPHSELRFYEVTNNAEAVGFFANRNHFAALLYVAILFIGAYTFEAIIASGQETRRRRTDFNALLPLVAWLTALVIVIAGEMMARSRAGLILTTVALLATASLGAGDPRVKTVRPGFGKAVIATTVVALVLFAPLAISRILDRFGFDPNANVRIPFARNTISAALSYMPFGSGLGSFVPVYQLFDKTPDIGFFYVNHAHNDLLELWLETGVFGPILVGVFLTWVLRRLAFVWQRHPRPGYGIDLSLQRAAAVALLLLLAHSLVDYPLRTTAMMTVAAVTAALLTPMTRD